MPNGVNGFDHFLFNAINGNGVWWLDGLFDLFSNRSAALIAGLGILIILGLRYRLAIVRLAITAGIALFLSDTIGYQILKPWFGRVRPCYFLSPDEVRLVVGAANVGSMPSLHAANSFAIAFVLTMLDRRLALIAYPVASLAAISRVYLGVHWPTDIIAGAFWGTFAGLAGWWLTAKLWTTISQQRQKQKLHNL
ncbi:MAG: phosphatase PAP2 family protein [Deltaproteobacteria bacterium]|nr:phosphatase PAP2 family protein [Deltaproteobacteria bacterium]